MVDPPLYELRDLLDDKVPGRYYKEQLHIAPNPNDKDYWQVEKVLKTRKRKGLTENLVKFLYYPGKRRFNILSWNYAITINNVLKITLWLFPVVLIVHEYE